MGKIVAFLLSDLPPRATRTAHKKQDARNPNQAGRKGMIFKHLLLQFPSDSQVRALCREKWLFRRTWMEKEDGSWACLKHSSQVAGMFS